MVFSVYEIIMKIHADSILDQEQSIEKERLRIISYLDDPKLKVQK